MNTKQFLLGLLFLFFSSLAQGQSFVSIDSLLNPTGIRKHIEVGLYDYYPTAGLGISIFKNKHSWTFSSSIGGRSRGSSTPLSEKNLLVTLQSEYRHRIKHKKQPVFWHIDAGLNYIHYNQESNLYTSPVNIKGSKLFPNIGFGTGYFFALNDKQNIEVIGTVNFLMVDKKISESINGVFIANSYVMVSEGLSMILKLRYSFQ